VRVLEKKPYEATIDLVRLQLEQFDESFFSLTCH